MNLQIEKKLSNDSNHENNVLMISTQHYYLNTTLT